MGYLHIDNLYRPEAQDILRLPEVYALEKVHGTSAHIRWDGAAMHLFPGGEKAENFARVFEHLPHLDSYLRVRFADRAATVYGEAYGGKCQGMRDTYGPDLRFIVFDVLIGETWLDVPSGLDVAECLGLEFVPFERIPTELPRIDAERDRHSEVAKRRGITEPRIREGVVLRPLVEAVNRYGRRLMAKHKRIEFLETKTAREVDPQRLVVLQEAEAIATEWVTPMRLTHVLDKMGNPTELAKTGDVVRAMIEDVLREGAGELVDSQQTKKAIGQAAARLFKQRVAEVVVVS